MYERVFGDLELAIKELGALDAHAMADAELSEAVVALARHKAAFEAAQATVAAVWDSRRAWEADGAKSASTWLAKETGDPDSECRAMLRLGHGVREMPLVAEAWGAGDIGAAHVRRLLSVRNRRTREAFAEAEADLVEAAAKLSFEGFSAYVDYWRMHADPDGADESEMERRNRRRVSLDRTFSGMWSGSALLDPISGEIVSGELRRLENKLFEADWAEARERLGREPAVTELARTPDQRRADALVEMSRRSAGADATTPARPLFTLVLGSETLARLCQLDSGAVVSPAGLVPWIDEADLERILFDGETGRVIDVRGRKKSTWAAKSHRTTSTASMHPGRPGTFPTDPEPQALLHRRPAPPHRGPGPVLLPRLLRRARLEVPGRPRHPLGCRRHDRPDQRPPGLWVPQPPQKQATTAAARLERAADP